MAFNLILLHNSDNDDIISILGFDNCVHFKKIMCDICSIIGVTPMNNGSPSVAKQPKKSRPPNVNVNFGGNNIALMDRLFAKEEILKR